jgi:hypothetical protein
MHGGDVFLSIGVGTFETGMVDLLAFCASYVYYRRIVFYISFIVVWGVYFYWSGLLVVVCCVRYLIALRASANSTYRIRMASSVSTVSVLCGIIALVFIVTSFPFFVGIY